MIWTLLFWKGAGERAIRTAAQVFGGIVITSAGADLIPAVGMNGVDWGFAGSATLVSVIISLSMSIGQPEFIAGKPAQVLDPDVIAAMNDDPEAKQRFQDTMTAALFMGADEPRRETTEDNPPAM